MVDDDLVLSLVVLSYQSNRLEPGGEVEGEAEERENDRRKGLVFSLSRLEIA